MDRANPIYKAAAAHEGRYRVLYGGAGSGKSVFVAQDMLQRAYMGARVLVVRKVARTLRQSTFALFNKIIQGLAWESLCHVHRGDMTISFETGEIIHAGLDDAEKLKSILEPDEIWIEEATELDLAAENSDLAQIDLRLRGRGRKRLTMTFNPTRAAVAIFEYLGVPTPDLPNRAVKLFRGAEVLVQHTTYLDNPYVGAGYVVPFARMGAAMQAVYERGELVMNDAPDQLIPYELVKAALDTDPATAEGDGRGRLGVDVARFGSDSTVFQRMKGGLLIETLSFDGQDTARTARLAEALIREHAIPAENVGVDVVGLGAGVADMLRDRGLEVQDVVSGAKPLDVPGYDLPAARNLRGTMWLLGREMLRRGELAIQTPDDDARRKLIEDLLAPRYRIGAERVLEVEPKDGTSARWGIRRRLGRSTDYGDPLLYALTAPHLLAHWWF